MYMDDKPLRLGTRGSPLALAQANMVKAALVKARDCAVEIVPIRTTGDAVQDRALAEIGGKALWTKELDRALIEGEIDIAVHSTKDIESLRPADIDFVATLPRADVRERLIGLAGLDALRAGMKIGSTSPRRAAQLRRLCPDIEIVLFRGNVATRLARIERGEADATLLASAGLDRLGIDIGVRIETDQMLPAPGQGAIGIECRADDDAAKRLLMLINDPDTFTAITAERSFAGALGGDCHSPVAALARRRNGGFTLTAEILREDGSECVSDSRDYTTDAAAAGRALAGALLARASPALRNMFTGD